jgi:hypothetical protein
MLNNQSQMFSKNLKRNVKVMPANKTEQLAHNNPYIIVPQTDEKQSNLLIIIHI